MSLFKMVPMARRKIGGVRAWSKEAYDGFNGLLKSLKKDVEDAKKQERDYRMHFLDSLEVCTSTDGEVIFLVLAYKEDEMPFKGLEEFLSKLLYECVLPHIKKTMFNSIAWPSLIAQSDDENTKKAIEWLKHLNGEAIDMASLDEWVGTPVSPLNSAAKTLLFDMLEKINEEAYEEEQKLDAECSLKTAEIERQYKEKMKAKNAVFEAKKKDLLHKYQSMTADIDVLPVYDDSKCVDGIGNFRSLVYV